MLTVDLTKDPILILLLKKIIRGAVRISQHDQKLVQLVSNLKDLTSHPESVDFDILNQDVRDLAELVKSYDETQPKELAQEENEGDPEPTGLPAVIYEFLSRLNELKIKTNLNQKYFSTAEIEVLVDKFYKMAGGK